MPKRGGLDLVQDFPCYFRTISISCSRARGGGERSGSEDAGLGTLPPHLLRLVGVRLAAHVGPAHGPACFMTISGLA